MMAHELPIPIHDNKKSHAEPIRKLPNGQLVDFGHNKTKKNTKNTKTNDKNKKDKRISQNLPDGSKPVFNTDNSNTTTSTSTSTSTTSTNNNNNNSKKNKKKPEEVYAGSSFHSSPEALNLPKPSFKTSPKPSGNIANGSVDNTTSGAPSHTVSPPQYPVTAYPPGSGVPQPGMFPMNYPQPPPMNPMGAGLNQQSFIQPGFQYQFNSNGNIMYPNFPPGPGPHTGPHPGPQNQPPQGVPPMPNFAGQLPFPQQPPSSNGYPIYTSHYQNPTSSQGQKISFNDLLGSTKT